MPLYLNNKTLSDYEQLVTMSENNRLEQAQAQVREVTDVMRVNVDKVLERDSKLSDLNSRADNLQAGANQFQTRVGFILTLTCHHTINMCVSSHQATRLQRKYWWQNMKMMMIIGVVVLILLIIIIVSATSG